MAKRKKSKSLLNTAITVLVMTLTGMAIREQLRLSPEERTWHGNVAGIPYDFRTPTMDRLRSTFWNKDTSDIFVPQAFGIGWTLNLYPLIHPRTQPV